MKYGDASSHWKILFRTPLLHESSVSECYLLVFTAQGNIWTDWTNLSMAKTAKGTLGGENEGILIDGQKMKRKSTKKEKKKRLDMKANISRCCLVYTVTIEKTVKL